MAGWSLNLLHCCLQTLLLYERGKIIISFFDGHLPSKDLGFSGQQRVSVQGVESLGGHFATLCREFDFYE